MCNLLAVSTPSHKFHFLSSWQGPERPIPRAGHSLVALPSPEGAPLRFVVHAGRTNDGVLCDDLWTLELGP